MGGNCCNPATSGTGVAQQSPCELAMARPQASLPAPDFGEFFRGAYQPLVRDLVFAGWDLPEAEDAVSTAMAAVLQHWGKIENPGHTRAGRPSAARSRTRNGDCSGSRNGSSGGVISRSSRSQIPAR